MYRLFLAKEHQIHLFFVNDKSIQKYPSKCLFDAKIIDIPPQQPTTPPWSWTRVILPILAASDSWGLFTQNIFPEKKSYEKLSPGGVPKVAPSDLKKNILFTLNSNISWFSNDRSEIISVIKNRDLKYFRHDENNYVKNCLRPITATSKRPWFGRFFAFSRQTRAISVNYFLIYYRKLGFKVLPSW